jgi:hypothetical protein
MTLGLTMAPGFSSPKKGRMDAPPSLPIRLRSTTANTAPNPAAARRIRRLVQWPGLRQLRCAAVFTLVQVFALIAVLPMSAHRALAEDPIIHLTGTNQSFDTDLVLSCPQDGSTEPRFQNQRTGQIVPITDPRLKAIAEKACSPTATLAAAESGNVSIVNDTGKKIFVGFSPQAGSSITWGAGCGSPIKGTTVEIGVDGTCQAAVTDSVANPGSRFCAATAVGFSGALDCSMAQQNNQTLIEPYFQPAPCFGAGTPNCIWYDISVIPANCTDADWHANKCAGTGGAAYNLPVRLSCPGEPTFTCRGPTNGTYGSANYPSKCGNPNATCIPGLNGYPNPDPACLNAYFYPDDNNNVSPSLQPNVVCPNGQTLTMTFLSGS